MNKNRRIKKHFVLQEFEDGTWAIRQFKDGSIWPATYKDTSKLMIARLLQILDLGPVAPQLYPEQVELTVGCEEGENK